MFDIEYKILTHLKSIADKHISKGGTVFNQSHCCTLEYDIYYQNDDSIYLVIDIQNQTIILKLYSSFAADIEMGRVSLADPDMDKLFESIMANYTIYRANYLNQSRYH